MSRLDLVREFVEKYCKEQDASEEQRGVEAVEVAKALSIWRNDASADLNKLCIQGILQKRGKKPVLYSPVHSGLQKFVRTDTEPNQKYSDAKGLQTRIIRR